ncbi:unnamed protein product [marine sediment metagenome]|uniref:Uncharacterized protein n=1 Tax=marine sediment metagenome TaxID=412755 RepID=X1CNW3_9ZZZZ
MRKADVLKIIDDSIKELANENHKKDIFKYWKVITHELKKLKQKIKNEKS